MIYAKIIFIRRNGTDGAYYPLTSRTCLFGRHEECDIPIQLRQVADNHCKINVNEDGEILLTNLTGNSFSVSLNGSPLSNTARLRHGDVFCIRERSFRFEVLDPLQKNPSNTNRVSGTELAGGNVQINTSDGNHSNEGAPQPMLIENTEQRNIAGETQDNSVNRTDGNDVETGSSTAILQRLNSSGLRMFHLRRIGPAATKPGVADVMDFWKVTSMIGRKATQIDFLIDSSDYVQGAYVSRLHARMVRRQNNIHRLFDDSLNGVYVNNFKIAGHVDMQDGDRVTFGHPQGSNLTAGIRVHQPDSEYQFMFEVCSCPPDSRPPQHLKHNVAGISSSFKVPSEVWVPRAKTTRQCRNATPTFTQEDIIATCQSPDAGTSLKVEMNEDISDQRQNSVFEHADKMQTESVKKDDSLETGHDDGSNEGQLTGYPGSRKEVDAVHCSVERMDEGEVEQNEVSFQANLGHQQEEAGSETGPSDSGLGSNGEQQADHTGSVTGVATLNGNSVGVIEQETVPNGNFLNQINPGISKQDEFIMEDLSKTGLEAESYGGQQADNTGSKTELCASDVNEETVDEEEVVQNEVPRDQQNLGKDDVEEALAKNLFDLNDITIEQHQDKLISSEQWEPQQSADVVDKNVNVEQICKCTEESVTEIEKKESNDITTDVSMLEADLDEEFNEIAMKVKTELLAVSSQGEETSDADLRDDETNNAQDQIYFVDSQVENIQSISLHPNVDSSESMGIIAAGESGAINTEVIDKVEVTPKSVIRWSVSDSESGVANEQQAASSVTRTCTLHENDKDAYSLHLGHEIGLSKEMDMEVSGPVIQHTKDVNSLDNIDSDEEKVFETGSVLLVEKMSVKNSRQPNVDEKGKGSTHYGVVKKEICDTESATIVPATSVPATSVPAISFFTSDNRMICMRKPTSVDSIEVAMPSVDDKYADLSGLSDCIKLDKENGNMDDNLERSLLLKKDIRNIHLNHIKQSNEVERLPEVVRSTEKDIFVSGHATDKTLHKSTFSVDATGDEVSNHKHHSSVTKEAMEMECVQIDANADEELREEGTYNQSSVNAESFDVKFTSDVFHTFDSTSKNEINDRDASTNNPLEGSVENGVSDDYTELSGQRINGEVDQKQPKLKVSSGEGISLNLQNETGYQPSHAGEQRELIQETSLQELNNATTQQNIESIDLKANVDGLMNNVLKSVENAEMNNNSSCQMDSDGVEEGVDSKEEEVFLAKFENSDNVKLTSKSRKAQKRQMSGVYEGVDESVEHTVDVYPTDLPLEKMLLCVENNYSTKCCHQDSFLEEKSNMLMDHKEMQSASEDEGTDGIAVSHNHDIVDNSGLIKDIKYSQQQAVSVDAVEMYQKVAFHEKESDREISDLGEQLNREVASSEKGSDKNDVVDEDVLFCEKERVKAGSNPEDIRDQIVASFKMDFATDVSELEDDRAIATSKEELCNDIASFSKKSKEKSSSCKELVHIKMASPQKRSENERPGHEDKMEEENASFDRKSPVVIAPEEEMSKMIASLDKHLPETISDSKEDYNEIFSVKKKSDSVTTNPTEQMEQLDAGNEKEDAKEMSFPEQANGKEVFLCKKERVEVILNPEKEIVKEVTSFRNDFAEQTSSPGEENKQKVAFSEKEITEESRHHGTNDSRVVSFYKDCAEVMSDLEEKLHQKDAFYERESDKEKEREAFLEEDINKVVSLGNCSATEKSNHGESNKVVTLFEKESTKSPSPREKNIKEITSFKMESAQRKCMNEDRKEESSDAGQLNEKNPDADKMCSDSLSYEKADEIYTAVCQDEARTSQPFPQLETKHKMEISKDDLVFFDKSNTGDDREDTFQHGCSQDLFENSSHWNVSRVGCTDIVHGIASADLKSIENVESASKSGRKRKLSEILQENDDSNEVNGHCPKGLPLKKISLPTENEHSRKSCSKDESEVLMESVLEHKTVETEVCVKNDTVDDYGCAISSIQKIDSTEQQFLPENCREIKNNDTKKYFSGEDQSIVPNDCGGKTSELEDNGTHDTGTACIKDIVEDSGSSMSFTSTTESSEQQCLTENDLETEEEFAYGNKVSSKEISYTENHGRVQDCTCNVAMNDGDCVVEPRTDELRILSSIGEVQIIDLDGLSNKEFNEGTVTIISDEEDKDAESSEPASDKNSESSELNSDKDAESSKLVMDKDVESSELVIDKDAESSELFMDKDVESSELDSVKGGKPSELVMDKDTESTEPAMDKDVESSEFVMDKETESSEHFIDKDTESSEPAKDKDVESSELVMDTAVESSEIVMDKAVESSELVMDKAVESSELVMDKDAESSEFVMDKDAESSELVMDKDVESSEIVMDKDVESSELVMDKDAESSELVMDKAVESSELVMDKDVESSELVMDKDAESSELVMDKDVESSELVMDKDAESSELVMDKDAESSELVMDKDAESSEIVMDKDAESSEIVMDKDAESSELVMDKDAESSEPAMDKDVESLDLVMDKDRKSSELNSVKGGKPSELVKDKDAESSEIVMEKAVESSEHVMDKDFESSEHVMDKDAESSELVMDKAVESSEHVMDKDVESSEHVMDKDAESSELVMDKDADSSEPAMDKDAESSELVLEKAVESSEHVMDKDVESSEHVMDKDAESSELVMDKDADSSEPAMDKDAESSELVLEKAVESSEHVMDKAVESSELVIYKDAESSELVMDTAVESSELVRDKDSESSELVMDKDVESSGLFIDKVTESSESAMDKDAESSELVMDKDAESSEIVMDKDVESSELFMDKDAESSEPVMDKDVESSGLVIDKDTESSEPAMDNDVESSKLVRDKDSESSELVMDEDVESSGLFIDKVTESSESAMDKDVESSELVIDKDAESSELVMDKAVESSELVKDKDAESSELVMDKDAESSELVRGKDSESSELVIDKDAESSEPAMDKDVESSDPVMDKDHKSSELNSVKGGKPSELVKNKDAESSESAMDKAVESSELVMDKDAESSELVMDKDAESSEIVMDKDVESSDLVMDKDAESSELVMDKAVESTELFMDKDVESSEPAMDKDVESSELGMDKAVESSELVIDKDAESSELVMDKAVESSELVMEKAVESSELLMEKAVESSELVMDKAVESSELVMDKDAESSEHVMDKDAESSEHVMDKDAESSELVMDTAAESSELVMEKAVESSELVMEKAVESSELVIDKDAESSELVMDKAVESSELVMDKDAESSELVMDKDAESSELVKDKDAESSEIVMDKAVESLELVMEKAVESSELVMDKAVESSELVMDKAVESSELVMDKDAESSELVMDKDVESSEHVMDKDAESSELVMDKDADSSEPAMDKDAESSELVLEKAVESSEHVMDKAVESSELVMDKDAESSELVIDKDAESSELVIDKDAESSELVSDKDVESSDLVMDKAVESSELASDKGAELSDLVRGKNSVSSEYGNSGSEDEEDLGMNRSCRKDKNSESLYYLLDEETTSSIKPCDQSEGSNQMNDCLHTELTMQPDLDADNEKACKKRGCREEITRDVDEVFLVQSDIRDKQGEIMQLTDKSSLLNVKNMRQLSEKGKKSETKSKEFVPCVEGQGEDLKPCSSPESEPLVSLGSDDWDANSDVALDTTENDTDSTLNDSTIKCLPFLSAQVSNENGVSINQVKETPKCFAWPSPNHLDDVSRQLAMSPVIPQQTSIISKSLTADQDERLFSDHSDDDNNGISSLEISALVDELQKTPIVDEAESLLEKTLHFSGNVVSSPLKCQKEAISRSPRSDDSDHFNLDFSDVVDEVTYDDDDDDDEERLVVERYRDGIGDNVSNVNQCNEQNVEDEGYVNENEEEHSSGNYSGNIQYLDMEDNENVDENFNGIISNDENNIDDVDEEEGHGIIPTRRKRGSSLVKRKMKNTVNEYESSHKKVRQSLMRPLDSPTEGQKSEYIYQRHNQLDSSYPDQSEFISTQAVLSSQAVRSPSKFTSVKRQLEYKVQGKSRYQTVMEKLNRLKPTKDSKEKAKASSSLASSSSSQETPSEMSLNNSQHDHFPSEGNPENVTTLVTRCKSIMEKMRQVLNLKMDVLPTHRVQALNEELGKAEKWSELPQTVIAMVGNTGDGKSSLMNAMLGHSSILPTSGIRACTAVVVEIVQNNGSMYEGCIEFLTKEEWYSELERLIEDLTLSNGNLRKKPPDPGSDQYVSYCKVKAVYGKIDKYEVLARINKVTSHLGQKKIVKHKKAREFRLAVERFIETQEPQSGGQFWPIVKHVQLRLPNCDVCRTGAALIDLPGVRDSNAARDKIAKDYLKNCSAIWVISAMHRAIDDKTAQDLLSENLRRQILMDGHYGSVAFICTKSDQFEISETIRTLKLDGKCGEHKQKINLMEREKQRLLEEIKICKVKKRDLNAEIKTSIKECEDLQLLVQEIEAQLMDSDLEQPVDHEPMEEAKVMLKEKEKEREKNKEAMEEISQDIQKYERQIQDLETQIRQRRRKISHICASARNDYCREKIKQKFQSGLKEIKRQANKLPDEDEDEVEDEDEDAEEVSRMVSNLRVFCCSSTEYQKMKDLVPTDGEAIVFNSQEETEIPHLQEYVHEITRVRHERYLERLIRGLGHCIFNFQSYILDGGTECGDTRTRVKLVIEKNLQDFNSMIQTVLDKLAEDLDNTFNDMIQPKFHEGVGQAAQEATGIYQKWGSKQSTDHANRRAGGLHWATYKATIQRLGVYSSRTFGNIDFNEELSEPFNRSITVVWNKVFSLILWRILETVQAGVLEKIQHLNRNVSSELQKMGVHANRIDHVKEQLESNVNYKLTEMVSHLKPLVTAKQRDINRILSPHVQSRLVEAYISASSQTGTGCFARMKQEMESGIDGRRMYIFDDGSQKMMHELLNLKTEMVNAVSAVCDMLQEEIKLAYEPLWEAPSQSVLLQDTFQQDMEEVCEEMRKIYRDAGLQNTEEQAQSQRKPLPTQRPPKRPQERKSVCDIVHMWITQVPEELTKMTDIEVLKVERGSNMFPAKAVKLKPGLSSESGMHNPSDVASSSGMDGTRVKMEVLSGSSDSLNQHNSEHPVPPSPTAGPSSYSTNPTFSSMAGQSDVYDFGEASMTNNSQHGQTHTKVKARAKQTQNSKASKNVPPEVRIALENHMVKWSTETSSKHEHVAVSAVVKQKIGNSSTATTLKQEAQNSSRGSIPGTSTAQVKFSKEPLQVNQKGTSSLDARISLLDVRRTSSTSLVGDSASREVETFSDKIGTTSAGKMGTVSSRIFKSSSSGNSTGKTMSPLADNTGSSSADRTLTSSAGQTGTSSADKKTGPSSTGKTGTSSADKTGTSSAGKTETSASNNRPLSASNTRTSSASNNRPLSASNTGFFPAGKVSITSTEITRTSSSSTMGTSSSGQAGTSLIGKKGTTSRGTEGNSYDVKGNPSSGVKRTSTSEKTGIAASVSEDNDILPEISFVKRRKTTPDKNLQDNPTFGHGTGKVSQGKCTEMSQMIKREPREVDILSRQLQSTQCKTNYNAIIDLTGSDDE